MSEQEKLLGFIQETLFKDREVRVTLDTLLFGERLLDSLNILHLIGYIEKTLDRRLTDDEIRMSNFASVRAMTEAFFHDQRD